MNWPRGSKASYERFLAEELDAFVGKECHRVKVRSGRVHISGKRPVYGLEDFIVATKRNRDFSTQRAMMDATEIIGIALDMKSEGVI